MTRRPVAVEPVKLILSKPVWPVIQGPSASPPLTILSTPGGSRSFTSSPNLRVESGVNGEGLRTIVLPASSAGPTLNIASSSGTFHGDIAQPRPGDRGVGKECGRKVRIRWLALHSK